MEPAPTLGLISEHIAAYRPRRQCLRSAKEDGERKAKRSSESRGEVSCRDADWLNAETPCGRARPAAISERMD